MPLLTTPDSWGSLQESNDCHAPAGSSAGGQFCSAKAAGPQIQRTLPPRLHQDLEVFTARVARDLKFPPDRITILPADAAYQFTLAGQSLTAAATYHPDDDKINVYRVPLREPPDQYSILNLGGQGADTLWELRFRGGPHAPEGRYEVRGSYESAVAFLQQKREEFGQRASLAVASDASVLAQEIQHHRWATVMKQYDAEMGQIRAHDNAAWETGKAQGLPYHTASRQLMLTNLAGLLRDEHKDRFPTVAALEGFIEGGVMRERLHTEDGISDYSRQWWEQWRTSSTDIRTVYNETQAEVAAFTAAKKYGRQLEKPKPAWRKFYQTVNREYTRIASTQRWAKRAQAAAARRNRRPSRAGAAA
jgi:hypothetical protein